LSLYPSWISKLGALQRKNKKIEEEPIQEDMDLTDYLGAMSTWGWGPVEEVIVID